MIYLDAPMELGQTLSGKDSDGNLIHTDKLGLICEFPSFNQKSAVVQASNQGQPRFNERFLDLAGWYGFNPRA